MTATGAVERTVVGTLRDGAIDVDGERAFVPTFLSVRPEVPCPEPAGGWPPGGEPWDDRSPDDAAYNAFLARHQELGGRELGPAFPGRLCVVVAEAGVDVDAPARAMEDLEGRRLRGMMSAGTTTHDGLRRVVHVELMQVTDEALAFQAAHPDGVVQLDPHLRVVEP